MDDVIGVVLSREDVMGFVLLVDALFDFDYLEVIVAMALSKFLVVVTDEVVSM